MIDISWGEIIICTGLAFYTIGKKDLPSASRFAGSQVGRLVGFLQGARARADRFAADSELYHLRNELRSGLRELDVVRGELAMAASSSGIIGREFGSSTLPPTSKSISSTSIRRTNTNLSATAISNANAITCPSTINPSVSTLFQNNIPTTSPPQLASRLQSIAAVAEDEWPKQGIGFKSRAELGTNDNSGSMILADLLKESLIYDQYQRVVSEQDDILKSRIQDVVDKNDGSDHKSEP